MRLTTEQIDIIRKSAEEAFGEGSTVTLFGSRVDDHKRGGDIDLLVHPARADDLLRRKLRMLTLLELRLGERKVDVVVETPGDNRPIVRIARETGVAL
ncbi:nucleotidyltransferase domain-containing protein [Thioalkalivibrio sulfidiphilus]|uniref:nucleotidyltransferase domain-containing protein n=1 Tax=Thioalkalivibrio sulfidiphilus TaxID=1033854 RepID=UPI0003AB3169|nr:nucleotidyltransferase domain-containing protein [Thioalkalivibrio sulfidiphilus]